MVKVLTVGAYLCRNCGRVTKINQDLSNVYVLAPVKCEVCGSIGPWEMLTDQNETKDLDGQEWEAIKQRQKLKFKGPCSIGVPIEEGGQA